MPARAAPLLLPLALLLLLGSACAIDPETRRPSLSRASREADARAGEQEARRVEQELGLLRDEALLAYVARVGEQLAAHSPRRDLDYRFLLVDSDLVNVFAIPGGTIYLTRGLLTRLNREDELASLLGHELGHLAERHPPQRISAPAPADRRARPPAGALDLILPGLGRSLGSLGQAANALARAPYSASQEAAADRLAQRLVAAAGWEPAALADALHTLAREQALDGDAASGFFSRTHPLTPERIEASRVQAAALSPAPRRAIATTRQAFLRQLEGLLVGEDPAQGVFRADAFLQPDLDLRLVFPSGWPARNGRDFVAARSPDGAARVVLQLAAKERDPLEVARDFAKQEGAAFGLLPVSVHLGGHAGARAYGHHGGVTLDVSWIAQGAFVYQITGVCANGDYDVYQTPFIDVALSLRPLEASERETFTEARLALVPARAGESLAQLVERHTVHWSVALVAVANGLEVESILERDQPIKLPLVRPYAPQTGAQLSAAGLASVASPLGSARRTARVPRS